MKLTSVLLFTLKITSALATAVGFKCSNSLDSHLDIIPNLLQMANYLQMAKQSN